MIGVNLALIPGASLAKPASDGTSCPFVLGLDKIAQAESGRRENVSLERLASDLPAYLHPTEANPARNVLKQMVDTGKAFPFAIWGDVCFSFTPFADSANPLVVSRIVRSTP